MAFPDFLLDPNAVLKDEAKWRYKTSPSYSASITNFEATKTTNWAPQSKVDPAEWRTIAQGKYSVHLNGGPGMSADDMLRLGTYNALAGEKGVSGVYEPAAMDFETSHKLFKGALKTFNWEVMEVIGAPPKVSIKWRHWGTMTGNYRAKLNSGRTVFAKANNKTIEIFGVTIAEVDEKFQIVSVDTFWDPDTMFRQLISEGLET